LIISIPTLILRAALFFVGLAVDLEWGDKALSSLFFIEKSVLQLPFFLMSAMRFSSPAMDEMLVPQLVSFCSKPGANNNLCRFMKSVEWVDYTYVAKHKSDDPSTLRKLYYPTLSLYRPGQPVPVSPQKENKVGHNAGAAFVKRYARRAAISLAVYLLTFMPYIGP
jgi:hypothetical protein